MLVAVALLAVFTISCKAAASVLPPLPERFARRTGGLAPALLAALVATEVLGEDGFIDVDAKLAGVVAATALAAVRAPFALCVVAGAGVAAVLRQLGVA